MDNAKSNWAVRFYTLWTGQALSLLGSQLVQFAIIWYLTQTTKSATTLAIASMMGLLPGVLLSPFIGTWVDRGNRKQLLIAADSIVAIATFFLALLFAFERVGVWHIYIALFIRAVAGGFHQSAFGASVVLLVPKDQLARVQGFNQALYGGLNIISAPLGAFLLAVLPMQGRVFAFIFSAAMLVSPIALLVAGPFADAFGIQLWFLIAGASCMAMGVFGFFSLSVMKMESDNTRGKEQVTAPQA